MPTYEYRLASTGEVLEVKHSLHHTASTWGELSAIAELDPATHASDTAVERLIAGSGIVSSSALKNPEAPPCATGQGCCGGGGCGFG